MGTASCQSPQHFWRMLIGPATPRDRSSSPWPTATPSHSTGFTEVTRRELECFTSAPSRPDGPDSGTVATVCSWRWQKIRGVGVEEIQQGIHGPLP
jgi:hypothetical protein